MISQKRAAQCSSALVLALALASPADAATYLRSADDFAVLGAAAVTNDGLTAIHGDLGVWPGVSITGMATITLTGTAHPGDVIAEAAHNDASAAYGDLAGLAFTTDLSGQDLGALGVLTPGVYRFASSAQLTGGLILDFAGAADGLFVFQIGSTLNTAVGSSITVLNGSPGSGIFWNVGSSATLGGGSLFAGNILAAQSITLNSGAAILCGRAIALNAAITMNSNRVSNDCMGSGALGSGRGDFGSGGFAGVGDQAAAVPEPVSWALMTLGFGLLGAALRRNVSTLA